MRIKVERKWKKDTYTIGRLYIDGVYFCNTLEDKDRGLKQTDNISVIRRIKVYGKTAIPAGTYNVQMNVISPKYAGISWYQKTCRGRMPRLEDVPGFEGILIHPGNTEADSFGCILVGKNTVVGQVTSSRDTFAALYKKMRSAADRGEKITIEII